MYESLRSGSRPRGLRHGTPARFANAAATFNGVYMRPNQNADGTIPFNGWPCDSPDIWISGTTPIDPNSLTTQSSYANISSPNIAVGDTNYIYVRGKNGATTTQSRTVQLYYAPSAINQWPGMWQSNQIPTDQGTLSTNINNLAPGAIGVASNVFQWQNVPALPPTSDHYCLFAQLNDASNSNPFPDITSQLDMAALLMNNLGWGWRNTVEVPGSAATWSYKMGLSVPAGLPSGQYFVYVTPTGYNGWSVQFQCSQVDSKGHQIAIPQTIITQDGQLSGVVCTLDSGFNASVTVSMFQNGAAAALPGAHVTLACRYGTNGVAEAERAVVEGLVNQAFERQFRRQNSGIQPLPWVKLGAQHYVVTNASARRR